MHKTSLTLAAIVLLALPLSVGASTINTSRVDANENDVSPLVSPISFTTDVVMDECSLEATRFRIMTYAGSDVEIASGSGSQTVSNAIQEYAVGGPYQPHIYYFLEEGYDGDLEDACSAADVFDPFEVVAPASGNATTSPTMNKNEQLFIAGVVIFFLSMIAWPRIISFGV